jgi:hypothetical protein
VVDKLQRYDEKTQTIWIDRGDSEELIPRHELQSWVQAIKQGVTADGRALRFVNYVFSSEAAAEYNHQPLDFARVGTYVGGLESSVRFHGEGSSFDTVEDFGIA